MSHDASTARPSAEELEAARLRVAEADRAVSEARTARRKERHAYTELRLADMQAFPTGAVISWEGLTGTDRRFGIVRRREVGIISVEYFCQNIRKDGTLGAVQSVPHGKRRTVRREDGHALEDLSAAT